jgi:hypothetical protein
MEVVGIKMVPGRASKDGRNVSFLSDWVCITINRFNLYLSTVFKVLIALILIKPCPILLTTTFGDLHISAATIVMPLPEKLISATKDL